MPNYFSSKCFAVALVISVPVLFMLQRFQVDDIYARTPANSADFIVPDKVITGTANPDSSSAEGVDTL